MFPRRLNLRPVIVANRHGCWQDRLFVLILCTGFVFRGQAANWPAWRGPEGTGVCPETNLPLRWDRTNHIQWRAALPERGNSTPIVWGERLFLTQAIEKENRRALLCFDRRTGKLRWEQGPRFTGQDPTHETNPHCASSPVTDGERVVAWFGSAGIYCYDLEGNELWHRDLGTQRHIWGYGASPVIHGDLCLLNFGPGEPSYLLAVNKKTGRDVWRLKAANTDTGEEKPGQAKPRMIGSWSTPIIIHARGREEWVVSWPERVFALDPPTGRELWRCDGLNPLVYTSPLFDPESRLLVAMGGFMGMALAVEAGGEGDITETRRRWHHPKTRQRIGSGVIHDGHIYIHTDPGVAECWELATGKLVWEERLKGPDPKADNWSSMVVADGKLYSINQGGDAFVLKASPRFEVLATNSLAEPTVASLAISGGAIFIRTHAALWCVAERPQ